MSDNRVEIDIEMSQEEFLIAARAAHNLDITLNRYIETILEREINRVESLKA